MITRKQITNFLRWLLKTILILFGFVFIIMPFVPAFKEYFFNAPEKEFASKEVVIMLLGVLIFTGGIYSNTIVAAGKNMLTFKSKNIKENV